MIQWLRKLQACPSQSAFTLQSSSVFQCLPEPPSRGKWSSDWGWGFNHLVFRLRKSICPPNNHGGQALGGKSLWLGKWSNEADEAHAEAAKPRDQPIQVLPTPVVSVSAFEVFKRFQENSGNSTSFAASASQAFGQRSSPCSAPHVSKIFEANAQSEEATWGLRQGFEV